MITDSPFSKGHIIIYHFLKSDGKNIEKFSRKKPRGK